MRKILILITIITLVFLLFLTCVNSKEVVHKQRIKDYSDVKLAKYTLQEWEDLGVNVWKKYYSPERWKELEAKSSWIDYEHVWKGHLDFVLEMNQKKGLVIDKKNIEIWAKPLSEDILPIRRWFWLDDIKLRIFACEYTIVYNGKKLRTYRLDIPPTEGYVMEY